MGLSVAVVGLFGFLSWTLTARMAPPSLVGTASALINAMLLAATIGQLQIGNVVLRWLPEAGDQRGTLLRRSYVTVAVTCVPVAAVVGVLLPDRILSSTGEIAVFCLAVVVWALFSLQDQVLAGLWRASVIPLENGAFVVLRLALVAALVQNGQFGILSAWAVPALVMLVVVSCFIPRLLRREASATSGGSLPGRADVVQFIAGNFSGSLAQLAVWNGLPMVVTALAGTQQGGIFFIVWSIVVSIELAAIGFSHALVVRAGGDLVRLRQLTGVTAIWFAVTFLPALLMIALVARPVLSLFGPAYAEGGTTALRLLMLGVACRLAPTLAIGVAQVRKESKVVIALQGAFALVLLGGAVGVMVGTAPSDSLTQVAAIYMAASILVAIASVWYLTRSWSGWRRPSSTVWLFTASLICWWIGAELTDPADLGLLGLLNALHGLAWCGLALMVVAILLEIRRREPRTGWGHVLVGALAVEGYALQPLIYGEARLPVAWLHAGWADYIATNGTIAENFDARFSWPGFFEGTAMLASAAGLDSTTEMLRWAPVMFIVAWLLPLALICRSLHLGSRMLIVSLCIFMAANWVEQEYFSPQAMSYLLYLSAVALCMRLLCRGRGRHAATEVLGYALEGRLRRGRVAAVPVVALVILALAPSHQLTPYLLLMTMAILAAAAGMRPRVILLIAAIAPVGWLVLGAHDFWSGHSNMITQDVGAVGQVVNSNVISRVEGSPERTWAQMARLTEVGGLLVLAVIGGIRMWRRRPRPAVIVAVLALAPVSFLLVQSYGGEMILRSWLFALPWLGVLAAHSLVPMGWVVAASGRHLLTPRRTLTVGCVLLLLTVGGLFSRSSNDGFTRVSPDQVEIMRQVYGLARPGDRVAVLSSYLPWKFARITDITGIPITDRCRDTESVARCVVDADPNYVVITTGQQVYGELVESYGPGFTDAVIGQLLETRTFKVFLRASDITVLRKHAPAVLAIGDSITRGDSDPVRSTSGDRAWPGLMHDRYLKNLGNVVNAGVRGNWTVHMRNRLPRLLVRHRPDVVVIVGGTNDVWQKSSKATAIAHLAAMVRLAEESGAQPVLVTIPPQEFHGGRTNKKTVDAMNAAIKRLAADTRTPLVDAHQALATAEGTWQEGLTLDGIHPSRQGALRLADLIDAQIEALIRPANVAPFGPVHEEITSNTPGSP